MGGPRKIIDKYYSFELNSTTEVITGNFQFYLESMHHTSWFSCTFIIILFSFSFHSFIAVHANIIVIIIYFENVPFFTLSYG